MKKDYGFKVGDTVNCDGESGEILKVYRPNKNGLGFCHAKVKYKKSGIWLTGLSDLKKGEGDEN